MNKEIEDLEKELQDLKDYHSSIWEYFGSELCAEEMFQKEEKLQQKINELKNSTNE